MAIHPWWTHYMADNREWELVNLELQEMPGLCLVAYYQRDGSLKPRIIAQPKGAIAFAAAWCDQAGQVKEWLDLWVQDTSSWILGTNRQIMPLANPALDAHWLAWVKGLTTSQPASVFDLGWSTQPCPVIWLNPNAPTRFQSPTPWALCTDDAILRKYRLAAYADSHHRYLWNQNEQQPQFLATTPDAPEGPVTATLDSVFGAAIPINRDGALMTLRRSYTLPLGDFSDLLANKAQPQDLREALRVPLSDPNAKLLDKSGTGSRNPGLFFVKHHMAGHLGELFHLKLAALHGVFTATQCAIQESACPFLGLTIDSFGMSLPQIDTSLPFLWGHQVSLLAPPQCLRTEIGDIKEPCFIPYAELGQSIYRSPKAGQEIRGLARVRIRKISEADDQGLVVMEGTLLSEETLQAGRLDLLGMEWVMPRGGRLCLYAKIEGKSGEIDGELRFCSLQTKLPPDLKAWLEGGKGSLSSDRVEFHLLPRVGTPCDLYSLGVIALRILLHHPDGTAAALDDLLSLAKLHQTRFSNANWHTGTASLAEFVKADEASKLAGRLSPHWLLANSDMNATDAFREVPAALWWSTIDFIARLFPGEAADAFCKTYDDFLPRALHDVFVGPIAVLESLLGRSREMLFGNPTGNRELLNLVRQVKNSK